jgi:hypothetical protein
MNPTVQSACSVIVLRAMESVTFAEAQMRQRLRTLWTYQHQDIHSTSNTYMRHTNQNL